MPAKFSMFEVVSISVRSRGCEASSLSAFGFLNLRIFRFPFVISGVV